MTDILSSQPKAKKKYKGKKRGRKTVFTPEVIRKLEEAAAMDCTIMEMALYADISRETLYSKLEDDKVFSDRIAALRNRPFLKARTTIINGLGDTENAQWYLERKKKAEFSTKQEVEHSGKVNIASVLDEIEKQ